MIHVMLMTNEAERSLELYAKGHAGHAQMGEDIVCAAVSILCFSLDAYIMCQTRERFRVLETERGEGYTHLSVAVDDSQEYETLTEIFKPARLAFMRLAHEFPRRIVFQDIPR